MVASPSKVTNSATTRGNRLDAKGAVLVSISSKVQTGTSKKRGNTLASTTKSTGIGGGWLFASPQMALKLGRGDCH